jgi:hypothetical protein
MSKKLTIEEMQDLAKNRDGKCLSKEYLNANTKLLWRCEKGHKWEATPGSVKSGSWCRYCAGTVKLTIGEMREIAKSRGGKCLSKIYVNKKVKLKWQCSKGHIWKATPDAVKRGTWCPACARSKGSIK